MPIKDLPELDFDRLFDLRVNDSIRKAQADPDEAAGVLLLAAEYLRQHKLLPYSLADYLADAFEAAMVKPPNQRVRELGFELQLTHRNRPPHTLDITAAYALIQKNYHLVDQSTGRANVKTPELRKLLMKQGNCSDSLARRRLNQIDKILQEEEDEIRKRMR